MSISIKHTFILLIIMGLGLKVTFAENRVSPDLPLPTPRGLSAGSMDFAHKPRNVGMVKSLINSVDTYGASHGDSVVKRQELGKEKPPNTKKISLNFQKISIRTVLQLLADFSKINIVVGDTVTGTVTLRLHQIPWERALDIILSTQHLDKRKKGNVLMIDTKENLDKLQEVKFKSQEIMAQLEPMDSNLLQINYAKAADVAILIKDKQNSLLSDRGKIRVDLRTNTIWIQETPKKIAEIKALIKKLDIPVKQVLIEARIVEVSKDFSRELGIRWGISRSNNALADATPLRPVVPETRRSITDRLNLDLIAAPASLLAPAALGVALAKINDNILLDLELSAMESEGRAELISSPQLMTVNQQPALIESGQEIPYQEATASGATAVAFKKAVLSLKVTPHITPDNNILMDLQINQDTTSAKTFNGVPAILTKEIQTKVLVNNGQTIVLGGIYTQDKTKSVNRIPFFGALPIVGALFRNTQIGLTQDELLIFITPKIITNALSMPTNNLKAGSE